ncbi:MAG: hypothetical protein [Bacteriophage sp.]|nr:MAG: hypothetical protein [Bacteriophage sp.]
MTKLAEDVINSLRVKYARYLHLSANVLDDDKYLIGVYDGKMRAIQEAIALIKMMDD